MVAVVCALFCVSVQAEMRIWQDKKGNTIEAEFVTISAGKVVLRTSEGEQLKINPAGLSAADQAYLKRSIPPRIDISFSKKQDRRKD